MKRQIVCVIVLIVLVASACAPAPTPASTAAPPTKAPATQPTSGPATQAPVAQATSAPPTQSPAPKATEAPKATTAPTEAPKATTAAAGPTKATVVMQAEPGTMDPTQIKTQPNDEPTLVNIYDQLMSTAPDGKPVSGPGIATWVTSNDGKIMTFTIRKGVKFSNGDPLTAKDVLFTHNRAMKGNPQYISQMVNIDKVEVVDDYTVRFLFKQPDLTTYFQSLPQLLIASETYFNRVGEDKFVQNPVGTGPYKLVEWKTGQYVDLAYNENYWGTKPQILQARIIYGKEESTRVAMLQAGEVDLCADTPWPSVATLEKAGFKTARVEAAPDIAIQFHTLNPKVPWYDKRVRQAIAYAVDRKSIVDKTYYGIPGLYAWLGPTELGYDPSIKPYSYDPAKAKQLLAAAGYPNGFDMPLIYTLGGAMTGIKDVADAVAAYLKAVGINVKVSSMENSTYQANRRKWHTDTTAEVVALATTSIPNNQDPMPAISRVLWSGYDQAMYSSPQVDALYAKANATYDNAQRAELIKQIYQIVNDDMPLAQILSNVAVYTMKSNVSYTPSKFSYRLVLIKDITIK